MQLQVKMSDIHSNISDLSHKRQEELQNLEKSRQENHHLEENERYKLQNKIQVELHPCGFLLQKLVTKISKCVCININVGLPHF